MLSCKRRCPQIPCGSTAYVTPTLTPKWNGSSMEGKVIATSYIWRGPGRSFCWQLWSLFPLKTWLMSCTHPLGILAGQLGWSVLLPWEPLLLLAASLLGPSPARSGSLPGNHSFWWTVIPGLTTSLSEKRLLITCLHCSMKHRLSSALCGCGHPLHLQGAPSASLMWWMLALEVLCIHHARSLLLQRSWRDWEELENHIAAEKTAAREEVHVSGLLQVPSLPPLCLRSEAGVQLSRGPLCLPSCSLPKPGAVRLPGKTGLRLPLPTLPDG